jgi:hypothetical protein
LYLWTVLVFVIGALPQSTHWPWASAGACIASDAAAASTAAPHSPFRYVLIFRFSKLRRTLLSPGKVITEQSLTSSNQMIP